MRDTHVLPSLPLHKEWDGGDGYNGLHISIADRVLSDCVPQMGSYYHTALMGKALVNVTTEMLSATKTFIANAHVNLDQHNLPGYSCQDYVFGERGLGSHLPLGKGYIQVVA